MFGTDYWYCFYVKTVSIDELKRNLAALVAAAAGGERIVITRHGRPVASLSRVDFEHLHVGPLAERAHLKPLLRAPTRGAYLQVLADDRHSSDRRDG
jgi:antitoxin (DNA-binding transcriptional repressor) of toxin-antitoxin stability system